MLLLENLKLAIFSIKSNKMRAFLTMLGIIIGITSVITISALGEASKSVLNKEFDNYNKNLAVIYIGQNSPDVSFEKLYFSLDDLEIIGNKFEKKVEYMDPEGSGNSNVKVGRQEASVNIHGTTENYTKMEKLKLIHGRFLSESDVDARKTVAVVDKEFALKLFNKTDIIGEVVKVIIEEQPVYVSVIGVYETTPSIFSGLIQSDSTKMYVPYTLFNYSIEYSPALSFKVRDEYSNEVSKIAEEVARYAEKAKGLKENTYTVNTLENNQRQVNSMLGTVSLAIGGIGAISLVVGGIGIMNIMLVSVTERTREIGIRKSLGARRRDILMQFLIESMIVSAIGGIIGVALGLFFSTLVALYLKIPQPVTIVAIMGTVAFSAVVGIFFGLYPANKAAKLDPIDALRYE